MKMEMVHTKSHMVHYSMRWHELGIHLIQCVISNSLQSKLIRVMFDMWQRDVPIRIILLKARQWGGSTLIQVFMIWIQLVHLRQWNSVIVSHIENTAKTIRGMYTKILDNYDPWLLDLNKEDVLKLTPFENSQKTKHVISLVSSTITVVIGASSSIVL